MAKPKSQKQPGTALILKGHSGAVYGVAVTPDGARAVSASHDNTLRVWDLATGEALASFEGHMARVQAVAVDAGRHPGRLSID